MCLISGYQTVGEEYVNIIQIDKHKRNIPSKLVILYKCIYACIFFKGERNRSTLDFLRYLNHPFRFLKNARHGRNLICI